MEWSQENAELILDAWIRKFSERVSEATEKFSEETRPFHLQPFASSSLSHLIRRFSAVSIPRIIVGCVVVVLYACFSLMKVTRAQESSAGLGLAGVTLVAGSVASGLGLCALLSLPFTAATTQILPFLALGLGVDDMFLIVSTVDEVSHIKRIHKGVKCSRVGELLKRCGVSLGVTSCCQVAAFFAGALIPVPALRFFCLQAGLIFLMKTAAMLLVFPALVGLDFRRRDGGRADLVCCLPLDSKAVTVRSYPGNFERTAVTRALSPPGRGTVTQVLGSSSSPEECWVGAGLPPPAYSTSLESLTAESTGDLVKQPAPVAPRAWYFGIADCGGWTLRTWVQEVYAVALTKGSVKTATVLCLVASASASAWGLSQLKDGLDLADIVPSGSPEASVLQAQQKYFGFYNMFAVTQGNFEYPTKQKVLQEYHEAFNRIPWIIKNDDGGLPDSWLILFRDWLSGLQRSFDVDWAKGLVTEEGWEKNASDATVLAYKLLVQTGHVDHPVDKSLASQVRLVNAEGIINPKAFYNYLTAWVTNDALAYSASQADLRPMPRFWYHERSDYDLKIPKSAPLVYAQFPFYLKGLEGTEDITRMIREVREICRRFEDRGVPNFPTGIPFTFWEQYINLRFFLLLSLTAVLATVFVVLSVILVDAWAAALVVLTLATLILQLAGLLGLLGLQLSAAPAVLLVVAVGVAIAPSIHVTLGFLTAIGDRNRRVRIALTHAVTPVSHGAASTLVVATLLFFSEFDFVKRVFACMVFAMVLLGALDSLLFLPVLLSLVGPPAQVIPRSNGERLPLPSPAPSPPAQHHSYSSSSSGGGGSVGFSSRRLSHHHKHSPSTHGTTTHGTTTHGPRRPYSGLHGSSLSLTTITEEPASNGSTSSSRQSSHEILVEPQVVVETTTFSGPHGSCKEPCEGGIYHEGSHVTTTVTATAKVKVELHNKPHSNLSEEGLRPNASGSQSSSSWRAGSRSCGSGNSPTNLSVNTRSNRSSSSVSSSSSSSTSDKSRSKESEVENRTLS